MINNSKVLSVLMALTFITSPFFGSAVADGGVFGKGDRIFFLKENTQYAVIHHLADTQRMIITVNFDWEESNKTAWIFPIPSEPEDVEIDVADGAPIFSGDDIVKEAKGDIRNAQNIFLISYLMSVAIPIPIGAMVTSHFLLAEALTGGGVGVHKHLEKHGLTVEVISATEGLGIYGYLTDNGLDIFEGIVTQLDEYVERDFSFVVTWISDSNITARKPGIIIEFPTQKIYFPLILTSIYGTDVIPIELMVAGHVSPQIYEEIEPYCSVSYWMKGTITADPRYESSELRNFTSNVNRNWNKKFTRIEINAPSNLFREDLWFGNKAPGKITGKIEYAGSINNILGKYSTFPTLLILILFFSLLIALILGIVIFGHKKEDIPYYLLMGFGNFIGIIGLLIFTSIIKKKRKFPSKKVALFVISFILAFIISMVSLFIILKMPLQ